MVFPQCGANENILNVSLLYLNNCSIICSTSFLTISAERQNSLRLYISLYIWLQLVKCHVLHSDFRTVWENTKSTRRIGGGEDDDAIRAATGRGGPPCRWRHVLEGAQIVLQRLAVVDRGATRTVRTQ